MSSPRALSVLALIVAMAALVLTLAPGGGVSRAQGPGAAVAQEEDPELSETMQRLMAQRLATLRSIEDLLRDEHQAGRANVDAVLFAAVNRLRAELALADSGGRVQLLRHQVQRARELESGSKTRFKAGNITEVQVLQVVAFRLELEIRLELERVR